MSQKNKVMVFTRTTHFHHRGGFEDHILALYSQLSKSFEIEIVTTAHPEGVVTLREAGVRWTFLEGMTPGEYSSDWWHKSAAYFDAAAEAQRVDLGHSQSYGATAIFKRQLNKTWDIPFVSTFHGTHFDEYKTANNLVTFQYPIGKSLGYFLNYLDWKRQYLRMDKYLFSGSDYFIATSDAQKTVFTDVFKVRESQLRRIFNGMDVAVFKPVAPREDLRRKLGLGADDVVVVAMSRMEVDKGFELILKGFKDAVSKNRQLKLVLIGDGGYRHKIEADVDHLGLRSYVVFAGMIPFVEINDYLNLADIYVNHSLRQSGHELSMVEAMACEKAVIGSDVGSTPDLLHHRKNGELTPLFDTHCLARQLLALAADPDLRKRYGKVARETILTAFSLDKMVSETAQYFHDILDG